MTMTSSSKATPTGDGQIDDFDPGRPGASAAGWLKKVETFARRHHLSEAQKYSFAQGKLTGAAKDWLAGQSKVTDWHEFRQALGVSFPEEGPSDRASTRKHRTMERRKRTEHETVHEYIDEMLKLGNRLQLAEATVVRHTVAGLGDPVLRKAIPAGAGLQQLLAAIEWQREVEVLMGQYGAAQVSVDSFEKLASDMERFALDGANFTEVISGDGAVLKTISAELNTLLRRHRSALSCGLFDLGTSKTHRIVVSLVPGVALIDVDTPAPAPGAHKGSLQTSVISLLTCGVIQKSPSSSYVQPAHHIRGSELLLDLSHLNAICRREAPNLLLPQPLLAALSAFRYFTTLDFNAGHLQIPLEASSRRHFAFSSPLGPLEFRRAPKNFANTTIIFNKILIELARKLHPGDAVVLNDVLVVPGRDTTDGLRRLDRVLAALGAFGLTADVRRSRFFEGRVQLFNWMVQGGRVSSRGLPFEPGHPGQRLTLAIKLSEAYGKASLQRRTGGSGTPQTVGTFLGPARRNDAEEHDPAALVVAHLVDSIEHFRQFLLFVSFEVILEGGRFEAEDIRRRLVQVQQFDFELIVGEQAA